LCDKRVNQELTRGIGISRMTRRYKCVLAVKAL